MADGANSEIVQHSEEEQMDILRSVGDEVGKVGVNQGTFSCI